MTAFLMTVFWLGAGMLLYLTAGYPLWVFLRARIAPRPVAAEDIVPHITVLIPAHNEAGVMREKLENTLALDYPADRMDIFVASDGSTDGTQEIARAAGGDRIRLLDLPRRGKTAALNAAVQQARGEILVFTDADCLLRKDALRKLVKPFADPEVGGVAGNFYYSHDPGDNIGEAAHWNLDRRIKCRQSAAGSITSATGQLYAVRRERFDPIPVGVSDDFFVSANVVRSGYRLVFAPDAVARGPGVDDSAAEFRRKLRVFAIGFRALWRLRALCNPLRYGFYAVQIITQKVLCRLLAVPAAMLLFASAALWPVSSWCRAACIAQCVFHGLAGLGWIFRRTPVGRFKLWSMPRAFDLTALAGLVGLFRAWGRMRGDAWTPRRVEGGLSCESC